MVTTRQTIKICNAIADSTSTGIRLNKDQIKTFSHRSVIVS